MKKPNLNNFGKQLKFSKRRTKKQTLNEKDLFIQMMDNFLELWKRSNSAYETYKINLLEYEEGFYHLIESLTFMKFGPWKTELILWFVFSRIDEEGNVIALKLNIEGKGESEVVINNAEDLWEFIRILEEEEKKDSKDNNNNQQK
jgi:hypothetical protein